MNNIQIHKPTFSLQPSTFQEAKEYAEILAKSTFVPKDYYGKAGNILAAVQYGAEIGLKPLQALQNIAVINGRPSIYGDAALALVKAHTLCIGVEESFDKVNLIATCIAKRRNKPDVKCEFSKEDAEKAGLWEKTGPWKNYPKRMLQMRARSFALRDQFPDVLLGLILAEEAQDYEIIDSDSVVQDKNNVVPIKTTEPIISIHEPPSSTYRFAELDATFTENMTAAETLKYLSDKITALKTLEDDANYAKFKEINAKLINRYIRDNPSEAKDLGNTYKSQKAFIISSIEEKLNTIVNKSENKEEVENE